MVFNPSPCLSIEERRRAYGLYYTNGDEISNTILYRGKLITYIQEGGAQCLISHTFKSSSSSLLAFVKNPAVLRAYTVEAQTTLTGFFQPIKIHYRNSFETGTSLSLQTV